MSQSTIHLVNQHTINLSLCYLSTCGYYDYYLSVTCLLFTLPVSLLPVRYLLPVSLLPVCYFTCLSVTCLLPLILPVSLLPEVTEG